MSDLLIRPPYRGLEHHVTAETEAGRTWLTAQYCYSPSWQCGFTYNPDRIKAEAEKAELAEALKARGRE